MHGTSLKKGKEVYYLCIIMLGDRKEGRKDEREE